MIRKHSMQFVVPVHCVELREIACVACGGVMRCYVCCSLLRLRANTQQIVNVFATPLPRNAQRAKRYAQRAARNTQHTTPSI